jgi:hypothetical protein
MSANALYCPLLSVDGQTHVGQGDLEAGQMAATSSRPAWLASPPSQVAAWTGVRQAWPVPAPPAKDVASAGTPTRRLYGVPTDPSGGGGR